MSHAFIEYMLACHVKAQIIRRLEKQFIFWEYNKKKQKTVLIRYIRSEHSKYRTLQTRLELLRTEPQKNKLLITVVSLVNRTLQTSGIQGIRN
jgi:hypothetical protein